MQSNDIRSRYLEFFRKRGHAVIPSASLVPENDPTVLFNTAGMQPLVPFLLGQKHPSGTRIVDVQKCVRTDDIEEVGDNTHLTFFEMLGNWSLGDYFKKESIQWSYEFLTSKEEGLGLDPKRLYITCFEGDEFAPKDEESAKIWMDAGIPKDRIYFLGAKDNWWPARKGTFTWTGPTGPDTEIFYDLTEEGVGDLSRDGFIAASDDQRLVEIWNNVFMEYETKNGKILGKLAKQNVDTGMGLERTVAVLQKKKAVFETDLFTPIIEKINEFTTSDGEKSKRIIADHVRAACFTIADGVLPANTDQGYILRRLIRRAVRHADLLQMKHGSLFWIAQAVIDKFGDVYPELRSGNEHIKREIDAEEQRFRKTLTQGLKEFEKLSKTDISGKAAFDLFSTYGFPIDMTNELAKERGISVDLEKYEEEFKKHQELSRVGAEKKFKGGLGDTSEMSLKYHTATHLLNAALRQVLGTHVMQKGSNITPERLRFDFSHSAKMTDEEKKKVEDIVNDKIKAALPVSFKEMPKEEAEKTGAVHAFGDKYGDIVKVYTIGDEKTGIFSREFCGGPHVENTSVLGTFKIQKEEAVSQGVRRIKAILE